MLTYFPAVVDSRLGIQDAELAFENSFAKRVQRGYLFKCVRYEFANKTLGLMS